MRAAERVFGAASRPEAASGSNRRCSSSKAIAAVAGLHLSDERIERDLAAYKGHLAAIESIRGVELPIEAEPASVVVLEQA